MCSQHTGFNATHQSLLCCVITVQTGHDGAVSEVKPGLLMPYLMESQRAEQRAVAWEWDGGGGEWWREEEVRVGVRRGWSRGEGATDTHTHGPQMECNYRTDHAFSARHRGSRKARDPLTWPAGTLLTSHTMAMWPVFSVLLVITFTLWCLAVVLVRFLNAELILHLEPSA